MEAPRLQDVSLIALAASSGAFDAISFLALGNVFTAFMTGNLVFLGFGVAGTKAPAFTALAAALAGFSFGVFVARLMAEDDAEVVRFSTPSFRAVLGMAAVAETIFLAGWIAVSGHPLGGEVTALIAVLAVAMGLQSGAVRALGVDGIFTTAATATLITLASDIAAGTIVAGRFRLQGVLVGLVAGALAGATLLIHVRPLAPVLPLGLTVAVVLSASRLAEQPLYNALSSRRVRQARPAPARAETRR